MEGRLPEVAAAAAAAVLAEGRRGISEFKAPPPPTNAWRTSKR